MGSCSCSQRRRRSVCSVHAASRHRSRCSSRPTSTARSSGRAPGRRASRSAATSRRSQRRPPRSLRARPATPTIWDHSCSFRAVTATAPRSRSSPASARRRAPPTRRSSPAASSPNDASGSSRTRGSSSPSSFERFALGCHARATSRASTAPASTRWWTRAPAATARAPTCTAAYRPRTPEVRLPTLPRRTGHRSTARPPTRRTMRRTLRTPSPASWWPRSPPILDGSTARRRRT